MTFKYVLDTNVFIQAHRRWYQFSFAQGFWTFLVDQHRNNVLTSIDKVRGEIKKGDELYDWMRTSAPGSLFASTRQVSIGQNYSELINWVMANPRYDGAAKAQFARDADCWVMAFAKAHGATVVSHEVSSQAKGRVKMPDVCQQFSIDYRNTFYMLDSLHAQLGLPSPKRNKP